MIAIKETTEGIIFTIAVLPKSSRNMVAGVRDGAIKIKITAPPVDGAANKMCVAYLSKMLKTPKSSLEIVSGATGRTKQILWRLTGTHTDTADQKRILQSVVQ